MKKIYRVRRDLDLKLMRNEMLEEVEDDNVILELSKEKTELANRKIERLRKRLR